MKLEDVPVLKDTIFQKIGIDCFAMSQPATFITHEHKDHLPREHTEIEYLVPLEIVDEKKQQRVFERIPNEITETSERVSYKIIGKFPHIDTVINLYLIKSCGKKIVIVGDYDSAGGIFLKIREAQPDIAIIPVYARVIKGRLTENANALYKEQRWLLDQLKSRRHWIDRGYIPPVVIGLKHSKRAKWEEGIDYFVDEKLKSYAD